MGITKYGYDVFFTITALCLILIVVALVFIEPRGFKFGLIGLSVLFFGFTANFFRDPERITPAGEKLVISPADGKVIVVKQVTENEYFQGEAKMVSIFMSPVNVHVNRAPISGTVTHYRYVKGEYFAAFDKGADYLGAAAYAGQAAAHEDLGDQRRAAELYREAALVYENKLTSPQYLLEAARSFEAVGDYGSARGAYQLISERFPESEVAEGIEFYVTRLDALQGRL